MKMKQRQKRSGSFLGIASLCLLPAMSGCSYSYPLEQDCVKRVSNSIKKLPMKWDQVHTQLLFDFSTADTQKAADILKNGYAGSGPPGSVTAMGNNKLVRVGSATGVPVITENGKEILIGGPSGAIKGVVAKACSLESEGVWLKSVKFSPLNPVDAEMSKTAN